MAKWEVTEQCTFVIFAVINLCHLDEFRQSFAPSTMTLLPILHLTLLGAIFSSVASRTLPEVQSSGTLSRLLLTPPAAIFRLGIES